MHGSTGPSAPPRTAPVIFHSGTALVLTLLFLVLWRVGYAVHFLRIRPIWWFVEHATWWLGVGGLAAIVLSMLYTPRRLNWFRGGSVRSWMKFHVWLGLIGPALIEIHGYGKNHGIAGWSSLLMWLTALSGFVGLYLRAFIGDELKVLRERADLLQGSIRDLHVELADHRVRLMEVEEQIAETFASTGVAGHEQKVRRGELARNPKAVLHVARDYIAYLRTTRALARRFRRSLRDERRATRLVARQRQTIIDLEIRAHTSGFMNELLVMWRLVHIPLSVAFALTCLVHLWAVWRY